jgi:hypothetical protein
MVFADLVLPNPREQHDGTAAGVGALGEQILIGEHTKRLIIASDATPLDETPGPPH